MLGKLFYFIFNNVFYYLIQRITDAELDLISKNMPDLEQFDILGSVSASYEAIEKYEFLNFYLFKYLMQIAYSRVLIRCKKLKLLDISFCTRIDMIYAKLLEMSFPRCSIKKSFQNE